MRNLKDYLMDILTVVYMIILIGGPILILLYFTLVKHFVFF